MDDNLKQRLAKVAERKSVLDAERHAHTAKLTSEERARDEKRTLAKSRWPDKKRELDLAIASVNEAIEDQGLKFSIADSSSTVGAALARFSINLLRNQETVKSGTTHYGLLININAFGTTQIKPGFSDRTGSSSTVELIDTNQAFFESLLVEYLENAFAPKR